MELIVFTNNGQTYHFHEVENFKPTTTGFGFEYLGKATGVHRSAVFNNTSAAGYALAEVDEIQVAADRLKECIMKEF
ncbi:hypothetical protein ABXM71_09050 [Enterococcus faecium]|nr:hypothetical protein [Enterococcus lactis]